MAKGKEKEILNVNIETIQRIENIFEKLITPGEEYDEWGGKFVKDFDELLDDICFACIAVEEAAYHYIEEKMEEQIALKMEYEEWWSTFVKDLNDLITNVQLNLLDNEGNILTSRQRPERRLNKQRNANINYILMQGKKYGYNFPKQKVVEWMTLIYFLLIWDSNREKYSQTLLAETQYFDELDTFANTLKEIFEPYQHLIIPEKFRYYSQDNKE